MIEVGRGTRDNLQFLIVEVESQVSNLRTFLATGTASVGRRIVDRSGYAYNLKMRIHGSCFAQLGATAKGGDPLTVRAIESIATDLERIAELCRECVRGIDGIRDRRCLSANTYWTLLNHVSRGIRMTEDALQNHDTQRALKIGACKGRMGSGVRQLTARYTEGLKKQKNTEDFICAMFVLHAIDQMGEAILNISEAVISANLGQPVNIERYRSLKDSVARLDLDEVTIAPLADTRSGSGISGISGNGDDGLVAIFKDGEKRKVKEKRRGVETWHDIYPGLAPKILSYRKRGQSASLLIEYLAGLTFEQIVLNEPRALVDGAFK